MPCCISERLTIAAVAHYISRGDKMRKATVIEEMKTNQEADEAVLEIDEAVRESTAALDSGNVRPSASGLVRDASGLVRDASGLVRDASGLVRDASGLVRDDQTAEHYKGLTEKTRNLSAGTTQFSRYVRRLVSLAETVDA
jgi:dynactin complex subunit